jgi:hypothetical protein
MKTLPSTMRIIMANDLAVRVDERIFFQIFSYSYFYLHNLVLPALSQGNDFLVKSVTELDSVRQGVTTWNW